MWDIDSIRQDSPPWRANRAAELLSAKPGTWRSKARLFMPLEWSRSPGIVRPPGRPKGAPLVRLATAIALTSALLCAGCAIRYDATGVSRIGVGLWGFGDPPGVNWNLDGPRRDVPELPASPRPELPPRRVAPQWQSLDMRTPLAFPDTFFGLEFAIGDNRDCASRCLIAIACPMAVRVRDRPSLAACG